MSEYKSVFVKLSDNQLSKVKKAIKDNEGVTIQVGSNNFDGNGNITLNLTKSQIDKIERLGNGKQVRLNLSKTQLKSGGKNKSSAVGEVLLKVTDHQIKEIDNHLSKLMALNDFDKRSVQTGDGIGAIFKLALPFVKNILPKVATTLGLSALGGVTSGLTHRATKGKGLRRATGGKISLSRGDLEKIMELGNACECHKIVKDGFVNKMNGDVKMQRGGFIGALLGTLAATLLPSLLSGKGLRRAGSKAK